MNFLLNLSRRIDAGTAAIGRAAAWLVLLVVLISAGNAMLRYTFNFSSNAYLEIQWYLFGLIFLACAGYTLLGNEHVRIDIVCARLNRRTQIWIDLFGLVFFLAPTAVLVIALSWPVFLAALRSGEMSNSAGGLMLWPARLMLPAGFSLLLLQAFSEFIKRIAFLQGRIPDPAPKKETPEEELAADLAARQEKTA